MVSPLLGILALAATAKCWYQPFEACRLGLGAALSYGLLGLLAKIAPSLFRLPFLKTQLMLKGSKFFLLSDDHAGVKEAPDTALIEGEVVGRRRLIFIRHGESTWNQIFNKGLANLPYRLLVGILGEIMRFPTADSVFYDAPLNEVGREQAEGFAEFLRVGLETLDMRILRGQEEGIIVSSNLRRCLQTAGYAMKERLQRTGERVHVLSSLQEIARNVDTMSVAEPAGLPPLEDLERLGLNPHESFDASENSGNKTTAITGVERMGKFMEWAFRGDAPNIVVSGHSLWTRNFCRTYLPKASTAECKSFILVNTGALGMTAEAVKDSWGVVRYRIDPTSLTIVRGGYKKRH